MAVPQEQKVIEPFNKPTLERIYRDLRDWYPELVIEKTPFGLCFVMWFAYWQHLHPASTPEYREMMRDMGDRVMDAAKDVEKLVNENEAMAKALEEVNIDVDEVLYNAHQQMRAG